MAAPLVGRKLERARATWSEANCRINFGFDRGQMPAHFAPDVVLDNEVPEIEMKERKFRNFVHLQSVAEYPWSTFMGRLVIVPDMPDDTQERPGIFDKG